MPSRPVRAILDYDANCGELVANLIGARPITAFARGLPLSQQHLDLCGDGGGERNHAGRYGLNRGPGHSPIYTARAMLIVRPDAGVMEW